MELPEQVFLAVQKNLRRPTGGVGVSGALSGSTQSLAPRPNPAKQCASFVLSYVNDVRYRKSLVPAVCLQEQDQPGIGLKTKELLVKDLFLGHQFATPDNVVDPCNTSWLVYSGGSA